jgi:hypothetical protein
MAHLLFVVKVLRADSEPPAETLERQSRRDDPPMTLVPRRALPIRVQAGLLTLGSTY